MMNETEFSELNKLKPFGWTYDDPPLMDSFWFERIDPFWWHAFIDGNWKLCYYVGALYILTIFSLQEYMKNRPPFKLKWPLFVWNMSLGFFSIFGFCRTVPELIKVLSQPNGFYNSICVKEGMNVASLYWGLLFTLSKFWELGDTIFIVLRKRPLIFLQWYHHVCTLCVVWSMAPLVEPIARWYGILNYFIHSWMYPYFALKSIGIKIPGRVANLITTLQFAQMIIGFTVNVWSMVLKEAGYDCARYPISIRAFSLVYGSFILLFGKLFYDSVIKSGRKKREREMMKKAE